MTLTEIAAAHAQLGRSYARAAGIDEHIALIAKSATKLKELEASRDALSKEIAIQEAIIAEAKSPPVVTVPPIRS